MSKPSGSAAGACALEWQLGGTRSKAYVHATRTYLGRGPGLPPWYGMVGINPIARPTDIRAPNKRFNFRSRLEAKQEWAKPPKPKEHPGGKEWTMEKLHKSRQFYITQGEMSRHSSPRARDNY